MVLCFRRIVVVQNMSETKFKMEECCNFAPEGSGGRSTIVLGSGGGRAEIAASAFHNRNVRGMRGSIIKTSVNGVPVQNPLIPQTFLHYVKIVIYVDDSGSLVFKGIKPKFTDICRFRGFGWLGREYAGRPEEVIE